MALYGPTTATATVTANTNSVAVTGMDLSLITPGMTINLGARGRKTGDAFIISGVSPSGSNGGTVTTQDSIPTGYSNAPFVIDTTGYLGTDASYAAAVGLSILATLSTLLGVATNLYSGARQIVLDKVAAVSTSRIMFSIAGRSWGAVEHRTFPFTPTGGQAQSVETLALRATPDGTTWTDALLLDLTNGTGDLRKGSATMGSAATVDLGSAPTGKVAITGSATISSFGPGRHLDRLVHVVDGGATLTHNATSLNLPTGANIVTRTGDRFHATSDGSGNWRVHSYQRADGTPLSFASFTGVRYDVGQGLSAAQAAQARANIAAAEAGNASDPNVLINSAFDNWQRSATPDTQLTCPPGAYTYLADRVSVLPDGAAVTQNRTFGIRPGSKARTSLQVNGAPGNTGVHVYLQRIEARDVQRIKRTSTLQVAIYNFTGAAFTPQFYFGRPSGPDNWASTVAYDGGNFQSCPAGAWTIITLTIDFSTLSNIDNGLQVEIFIPGGILNATSKYVLFSEMDLRPGSVVVPFERRPPDVDLAMCQRYFQPLRIGRQFYASGGNNSYRDMAAFNFRPMRAAPILTLGPPGYTSGNFTTGVDMLTASALNFYVDPTSVGSTYYTYNATLSAEP